MKFVHIEKDSVLLDTLEEAGPSSTALSTDFVLGVAKGECPSKLGLTTHFAHKAEYSIDQHAGKTPDYLVNFRLDGKNNLGDKTSCSTPVDEDEDKTQSDLVGSRPGSMKEVDDSVSFDELEESGCVAENEDWRSITGETSHDSTSAVSFADTAQVRHNHTTPDVDIERLQDSYRANIIDGAGRFQMEPDRDHALGTYGPSSGDSESSIEYSSSISITIPMQLFPQGRHPGGQSQMQHQMGSKSSECRTTVVLVNVPFDFTGPLLLRTINAEGFGDMYDFIHVPADFGAQGCSGFAVVNLLNPTIAQKFLTVFNKFSGWPIKSKSVCQAIWAKKYQGLQANIDRYRNSAMLLGNLTDDYKPQLFENGAQVQFPAPLGTPGRVRNL
eukprot:TRINITY_DN12202_c0_g1_i1.p1 TRINITY_DN12202_c0_g1~~TRINITY_DN12202_c0_g1_i1.p1  ORF type:complete len:385 (+),score=48.17 TRINITY_DN12202_c0_g1_i1:68-1222(+)